jgi:hypothetical protein
MEGPMVGGDLFSSEDAQIRILRCACLLCGEQEKSALGLCGPFVGLKMTHRVSNEDRDGRTILKADDQTRCV